MRLMCSEVVYKKEYNFKKTRQDRTSKPIKYSYIRSLSSFVELPLSHSIFHLILINTRTLQQERGGEKGVYDFVLIFSLSSPKISSFIGEFEFFRYPIDQSKVLIRQRCLDLRAVAATKTVNSSICCRKKQNPSIFHHRFPNGPKVKVLLREE
ncbi:hypothetical protein L1887_21927 [Cichorium endivia]|nr:hypothetical protein L1887_21927 [Cichorium endivia]